MPCYCMNTRAQDATVCLLFCSDIQLYVGRRRGIFFVIRSNRRHVINYNDDCYYKHFICISEYQSSVVVLQEYICWQTKRILSNTLDASTTTQHSQQYGATTFAQIFPRICQKGNIAKPHTYSSLTNQRKLHILYSFSYDTMHK